jgi:hypothetical protein
MLDPSYRVLKGSKAGGLYSSYSGKGYYLFNTTCLSRCFGALQRSLERPPLYERVELSFFPSSVTCATI